MRHFLALALAGVCLAQTPSQQTIGPPNQLPTYQAIDARSLSSAAEVLTIQEPATAGPNVNLRYATVYCSVACAVTFSQNGTAATATSLATTPLNSRPAGLITAWHGSNVGNGTTLATYDIAAGSTQTFDLSEFFLIPGRGTGSNFSASIASITGSIQIVFDWTENQQ